MKPFNALRMAAAGAGSSPVQLHSHTISKGPLNGTVTATLTIASDGNVYNQDGTTIEQWLLTGSSANYQVKADFSSGNALNAGSSATGVWLALSSSQSWGLTADIVHSVKDCALSISIRDAAAPNTVRAGPVTESIHAESFGQ